MARPFLSSLIALLVGAAALILGLMGSALRTGRLDPLDWLLPDTLAALLLIWRGERRPLLVWAIVTLPALLLLALAGTHLPAIGLVSLAVGLALAVLAGWRAFAMPRRRRLVVLATVLGAAFLWPGLIDAARAPPAAGATRPVVGMLSALPLQGAAMGAAQGLPPMDSIGLRSPLWQGLEQRFQLRPLDALNVEALARLPTLLLAHPGALSPAELVALDAWVRGGGHAVILADPLLHWPDRRSLAHPQRAPLTSLLDPLLTHWGLRLEPAEPGMGGDPVERRALSSGAVLQLSGASRFVAAGPARGCALTDRGLVAQCRIGAGQALLVADADWINDTLWTLRPEHPGDRAAWTGAALDILASWLAAEAPRVDRFETWLASRDALIRAVRMAVVLLLAILIVEALVVRFPRLSRARFETKVDQTWNKADTGPDTT